MYVSEEGLDLFGNCAVEALDLWSTPVSAICSSVTSGQDDLPALLKAEFPRLFSGELGKCNVAKATVTLQNGLQPPFIRARQVPYGARKEVESEISRLQQLGIITRIKHANAAAPIVVVKKKDGSVRVTADYSTGLNRVIQPHHHPFPLPENIFAELSGMTRFSNVDMSNAFLQIILDEEDKKLMAINTHCGLFQVNRMQPGLMTAPAIFQEIMEKVLANTGARVYLDDVIVPGKTKEENDTRLRKVLHALQAAGFTLRLDKCSFGQASIKYLGKIVDEKGIRPDPERLRILREMPGHSPIALIPWCCQLVRNIPPQSYRPARTP